MFRVLMLISLLLSSSAHAAPSQPARDEGITLREASAMTPREFAARALGQIAAEVTKAGPDVSPIAMRSDLNSAWLVARGHTTWETGICESQLIELKFEGPPTRSRVEEPRGPGAPASADAQAGMSDDPPRRAYRLAVTNRYAAFVPSAARQDENPCATAKLTSWVTAADEHVAARAFTVVAALEHSPAVRVRSCLADGKPCADPTATLAEILAGELRSAEWRLDQDESEIIVLTGALGGRSWRVQVRRQAASLQIDEMYVAYPPIQD